MNKDGLLALVRGGGAMRRSDKLRLVWLLALPAMLGQLSTIAMQYIDAIMVGQLGASAAAAIGLVSTSTWLFGGGVATLGQGFAVVVAHRIGAKDFEGARSVMRQGAVVSMGAALLVSALCVGISGGLPVWLGGEADVCGLASGYFLVWALTLPVKPLMIFCMS